MKASNYMNRAMQARDPRFKEILGKLGYERADLVASPGANENDIVEMRKAYQAATGKRAFHGWDADALKSKIAEARGGK